MSIGNDKDMVNCLTSWWKDFIVLYHVMQNLHVILTMKSDSIWTIYGPTFPGAIGFIGYEEFGTIIVLDTNSLGEAIVHKIGDDIETENRMKTGTAW